MSPFAGAIEWTSGQISDVCIFSHEIQPEMFYIQNRRKFYNDTRCNLYADINQHSLVYMLVDILLQSNNGP